MGRDTRQPFTVRIPAVLFVIGGLLARTTFLLEIRRQKPIVCSLMFANTPCLVAMNAGSLLQELHLCPLP